MEMSLRSLHLTTTIGSMSFGLGQVAANLTFSLSALNSAPGYGASIRRSR